MKPTVRLTDEERETLWRAGDHHPDQCDCDPWVIEQAFAEDCCCGPMVDTFAAVESLIAARLDADRQWRGGA